MKFITAADIKAAIHKKLSALPKKKFIVAGATAAALLLADFTLGARRLGVKNHSYAAQRAPCNTAECKETSKEIIAAVDLWRKTPLERKGVTSIPSYLNARYALRAAAIESNMGSFTNRGGGTKFDGAFQFACGKLLMRSRMYKILKVLNAGNDTIPILKKLNGTPLTSAMICSPENKDIYRDITVQTFMKMESVLSAAMSIEQNVQGFLTMSEDQKHSMLYLSHNLPVMVNVTAKNMSCERSVAELIPAQRGNFAANPGVYDSGAANSLEVLARISNLAEPALVNHMPWHWWKTTYSTTRRGEYGYIHKALMSAMRPESCTYFGASKSNKKKKTRVKKTKKAETAFVAQYG